MISTLKLGTNQHVLYNEAKTIFIKDDKVALYTTIKHNPFIGVISKISDGVVNLNSTSIAIRSSEILKIERIK